jgi:hypothetical protein
MHDPLRRRALSPCTLSALVERAWRLDGRDDALVAVAPLIELSGGRFADWMDTPATPAALSAPRAAETIGRPLGSRAFLDRLAVATGRGSRPKRREPKPKSIGD